jgi:hypothetical protein
LAGLRPAAPFVGLPPHTLHQLFGRLMAGLRALHKRQPRSFLAGCLLNAAIPFSQGEYFVKRHLTAKNSPFRRRGSLSVFWDQPLDGMYLAISFARLTSGMV